MGAIHPIMKEIWSQARAKRQTIVLPEANDERVLAAAETVVKEGLADIILIGSESEIKQKAKQAGAHVGNIPVVDPREFKDIDNYTERFLEIRKGKTGSPDEVRSLLQENPLYFGCMMVREGAAAGMVAGASHATADVLRPAFQIIKTSPGISIASAYFAMIIPESSFGEEGFLLYADPGSNPCPTAEELADIAITTCLTAKGIFGIKEPRAALLSFSTKGSGKHPIVDKVIEATRIANEKRPDLMIDGELQGDAALIPAIGEKKAPGSKVAGRANILIFPDLNSGNIAYKLTERLAGAEAYGPLMQGLNKPINDLSRGCKATDIVNVVAVVSVKAAHPYDRIAAI